MPLPRVLFPESALVPSSGVTAGSAARAAGALDLPEAELRAVQLDGELFALGDGYCPSDVIVGAEERLHSVLATRSRRLAAEGLTAAWVWGALLQPPSPLRLCCGIGSRADGSGPGVEVRELTLAPDELMHLGGLAVTSPLRTVVDIARDARHPDRGDAAIRRLLERADVSLDAAMHRLGQGRGLPGRRDARARLARLTAASGSAAP